jgi:selenocysteine lyase/cysteine desulfurase
VGERSNFILVPMLAASLRLIHQWTPERIQEYCRSLTADLFAEAASLGFSVEEEAYRAEHLFGLRMPEGLELGKVKEALESGGVYASLRGSALRVSPNVYNDADDVAALIQVLRKVV